MKIKTALKAAAFAATMAFAGASHAAIDIPSADTGLVFDSDGAIIHGFPGVQPLATYSVTGSSLADSILAFCVQPTVDQVTGAVYTEHSAVSSVSSISLFADAGLANRANRIQALFEQNYGSLTNGAARLSFAVALWDLAADDGTLATGLQAYTDAAYAFDAANGDTVDLVATQAMLDHTVGATLTGAYKYTLFTGRGAGSDFDNSQALLSVTSAVPEADTWAMMAVGLGLVGFMGRRKSKKSEKFAA